MSNTLFDAFTHGLSRNREFPAPLTGEDRKRNRKQKTHGGGKKIFARCTSQLPACATFAQQSCDGDADCLAAVTACCELLGACDFTAFVTCFDNAIAA